jgi:hypothetical protein
MDDVQIHRAVAGLALLSKRPGQVKRKRGGKRDDAIAASRSSG